MKKNRLQQIASIAAAVVISTFVLVSAGLSQNRGAPRVSFDVVSIRPFAAGPPQPGERTGGPGGGAPGGRGLPAPAPCPWRNSVVDRGRVTFPRTNTYMLLAYAYESKACTLALGLISGQPDWTLADLYTFEATIPAGTPVYGFPQVQSGDAPKLQEMLQTMLEDRFKLKIHREKRDVPVLELVVAKPGKMTPSKDQTPPPDPFGGRGIVFGPDGALPPGLMQLAGGFYQGNSINISSVASGFGARSGRTVIDKTGLTGFFDIKVPITPDPNATPGQGGPGPGAGLTYLDTQLLDGLGLKLESSKTTVEVIVIDHIEKPTGN